MSWADGISLLCILAALFFFLAGTVGLLRMPDVFTRLHALTKADNLGLGLIVLATAVQLQSWTELVKLALIWMLVMVSGATVAHLIARMALSESSDEKA